MNIRVLSAITFGAALPLLGTAALAGPTGTLSGQVRDRHGNPLVHARITVQETGEITATDRSGKYIFPGEASQRYSISADAAGYQNSAAFAIVKSDTITLLNFSLEKVVRPGRVLNSAGPHPWGSHIVSMPQNLQPERQRRLP